VNFASNQQTMKQIIVIISLFYAVAFPQGTKQSVRISYSDTLNKKQKAFKVLQNQCNICHRSQNPSMLFTLENMNGFAKKINRQVFVWKRMPKGNDNNLTTEEKETLKIWLNTQLRK
jgi:uncharacterized membrane protein